MTPTPGTDHCRWDTQHAEGVDKPVNDSAPGEEVTMMRKSSLLASSCLVVSSAGPALSIAPVPTSVRLGVLMLVLAVGTTREVSRDGACVQQIGALRYIAQMSRVATASVRTVPATFARRIAVVAIMIDTAFGLTTMRQDESHPMGSDLDDLPAGIRPYSTNGEGPIAVRSWFRDPGPASLRFRLGNFRPKAIHEVHRCHGLSLLQVPGRITGVRNA